MGVMRVICGVFHGVFHSFPLSVLIAIVMAVGRMSSVMRCGVPCNLRGCDGCDVTYPDVVRAIVSYRRLGQAMFSVVVCRFPHMLRRLT